MGIEMIGESKTSKGKTPTWKKECEEQIAQAITSRRVQTCFLSLRFLVYPVAIL